MKKPNTDKAIFLLGKIFLTLLLMGCNNDDGSVPGDDGPPVDDVVEVNYGVSLVSGAGETVTSFLLGLTDLDVSTIDNSDGTEVGQYTSIYSDGESMFTAGFGAPATMKKYIFDDGGKAVLDQEIIVPGSNSFSTVEILDQNKGYATVGGGISKVVEFNPTTMRITGEIDLSEAGEGLFYSDMIARDDHLFVALNDFGGSGEVMVAVVNTDNNTLEKVISDGRSATPFNTLASEIMALDSNGDIYLQASGLFSDKPSGVFRIKAGETDFDASYFFDLGAMEGKTYFGLYLTGNGEALTLISENDDNFFGTDGADPAFRYHKIDLYAAQDLGDLEESLPNTFAASRTSFARKMESGELLFPIAGVNEDALYGYDPETQGVEKRITSNGGYISGFITLNGE
ncbi:DUF4374 domain-containing protein [Flagellimonas marinaquae]|uniref:DUF4374 domain-containing protein n=1 Tax=Flagellimonas aurea TaxID=2915619 RepID=UPI001CE1652E|nr:DUF4374 domain-containing protein [Allomuricauda aquimarina]